MLKISLSSLFILFCVTVGYAQKKDTTIIYFRDIIRGYDSEAPRVVSTLDSADYFRVVFPTDSGGQLADVKEFYKNGKIRFVGKAYANSKSDFLSVHFVAWQGDAIKYFRNGKRQRIMKYENGSKGGIEYDYYPDGKLYCRIKNVHNIVTYRRNINENRLFLDCYDRNGNITAKDGNGHWINYDSEFKNILIEGAVKDGYVDGKWEGGTMDSDSIKFVYRYNKGQLINAVSYDKAGKEYPFVEAAVPATYKNGNRVYLQLLRNRIVLPKDSLGRKIRDTVSVAFTIQKDGSLTDFQIVGKPNAALGNAALAAVKQSHDWQPRRYYGIPLRTKMTFKLNMKQGGGDSFRYIESELDIKISPPPID